MKATEVNQYLGRQGKLPVEGGQLVFNVACHDVRSAYGRVDVLVTPVNGTGETWVSESRIQWEKD